MAVSATPSTAIPPTTAPMISRIGTGDLGVEIRFIEPGLKRQYELGCTIQFA